MWQWASFADIISKPDWKTFAFHQGNLGAGYPKPTRLLVFSRDSFALPSFCYEGTPTFDNRGCYLGPLPMAKGMGSIRSRQSQGPFKTSGTEMWPAKMCQWIATMLLSAWASSATTASKGVPDTQAKDDQGRGGHFFDMPTRRRQVVGWLRATKNLRPFWGSERLPRWRGPLLAGQMASR